MRKLSIIYFAIFFSAYFFTIDSHAGERLADHPWDYYYEKGRLQFRGEIYGEASINLEKALRKNPEAWEAAELLGDIHVIMNRRMKALEWYRLSLKIKEDRPDLHCKVGELYEFHAERELALKHFMRAVEIDPVHVRGNSDLVRYYVRQGKRELAREYFLRSYNAGKNRAAPFMKTAREEEKKGDLVAANSFYEKAIEAAPATIEAYMGVYENNRTMGKFGAAVGALERLIFVKPDETMAHIRLGHLFLTCTIPGKKKKYCLDRAAAHLETARELDRSNPHPCFILSDLYRIIGDDLAAEKYHRMALELENRKESAEK
ncbi:MAG TPA: tetratricopeptide repeat protein [Spirochaetota bacterium]|nr:tetratricopeptide repeat protein [Spirochaetota bacterium]